MIFSDQIHPKVIRQLLLLIVVFGLGFLIYKEMQFMLGAFMGALALYMLMRVPMFYLVYQKKWHRGLSALMLMLISLVAIVMPLAWVVNVLIDELTPMLQDTSRLEASMYSIDTFIQKKYGIDLLSAEMVKKIPGYVASIGGSLISATLSTITNLVIMYFVLYFMLVKSGEMERWIRSHLPIKNNNTSKLLNEIRSVVVSNTIGIPVLGAIQGIVAMIGYYMFGIDKPILWGIITGIASVIPFVGTMAAWVPLAILTFASGDTTNGYWLTFWGLIVIGGSDNVFRFVLQKYMADIHPLITVFGVIIGLNMFGFLGLIFGPLLISLFFMLVRIYNDEFVLNRDEQQDEELV
jgi:predicted PurR-regulated permease PerM